MNKRVITVVPCRTRSKRLLSKALMPIRGIPSIERCLINTLAIERSRASVLATSKNRADNRLLECTAGGRADVVRGPEEDVLERFLLAVDRHGADVVIRVTGDCPAVSYEIADILLEAHFKSNADMTYAVPGFPVGTGCEVYDARALRRLRRLVPETPYSEYLVFYFLNNSDHFKINPVDLPSFYYRNWRLTLDEQSDLDLFEYMYSMLEIGPRAISFREIAGFFEKFPEAAQINIANRLRYIHDVDFVKHLNEVTTIRFGFQPAGVVHEIL